VSEPVTVTATGCREFLAALYGRLDSGFIECRAFTPNGAPGAPAIGRQFYPVGQRDRVEQFIDRYRDAHVYLGIATRKDTASGTLKNCAQLPALFVDIDYKTTSEPAARARLAAFPFPPSLIVCSGGGLHVYWLLKEPLDLATEMAQARDALRRLAIALSGDLSAAECARVLRVPGSLNHKPEYGTPRAVTLERAT
jgi:hypothetical protein